MKKISIALCLLILTGCQPWPDWAIEDMKIRLLKYQRGLDCLGYLERLGGYNYREFTERDICQKNIKILKITHDKDSVVGIARCRVGSYAAEYRLVIPKNREIRNRWGGYICTVAHGDFDQIDSQPVGSLAREEPLN